jgi:thiol-disulfide isomerase/thioredoxin
MIKTIARFQVAWLVLLLLAARAALAQNPVDGQWDALVVVGAAEIPFRFEIAGDGDSVHGFFFEDDKKIASTSGKFADGNLELQYEFLNATLIAKLDGRNLSGSYRYNRKNGREYTFRATRSSAAAESSASGPKVTGDWEMKLVGEDHSSTKDPRTALSWKLYLRESGSGVSGSILRVDGDTGTLTGAWRGDTLVLSHFAGERPILLEAKLQSDGTLAIVLNRQNAYLAARTQVARTKDITAPVDPSKFTSVKDSNEPFHFRFPDANGKVLADTDSQFKNKVVILAVGGTWCPNCRDEAPFLVDLYKKYHAQGLEIVGLNFEASGDLAEDKPRIESFIREFSVPYPILYAGAIPEVKDKLTQLANFGAYPTTIYLARDGRVASIHAGFASGATGEAHTALQREVDELVERLLRDKSGETQTLGPGTSTR